MIVFDNIARDIEGPMRPTDTDFGYLNRSNRPEAERVRQLVEQWIARYPESHRPGLVARLRSMIDVAHCSAFFELALHELLIVTGHRLIEIEPALPHTTKSPDFLVEAPDGTRFYLEAVLATGKSADEIAAEARLNDAIHAVECADCPTHFLHLHVKGVPAKQVKLKILRQELADWISKLPAGEAAKEAPAFKYSESGLTLTVRAVPRNKPAPAPARAVGMRSLSLYAVQPGEGIRESLEKKASRYGDLELPYVVAVNAMRIHHDEDDVLNALFGTPGVVIRRSDDGWAEDEHTRSPDGVWVGRRGLRKKGLSAVLSTERLLPWSLGQRRMRIIRNPWADQPLPPVPLGVDELNPDGDQLVRVEGKPLAEILRLPAGWPED